MKDGSNTDKQDGGVSCWVGVGAAGWGCGVLGGSAGSWVGTWAVGHF